MLLVLVAKIEKRLPKPATALVILLHYLVFTLFREKYIQKNTLFLEAIPQAEAETEAGEAAFLVEVVGVAVFFLEGSMPSFAAEAVEIRPKIADEATEGDAGPRFQQDVRLEIAHKGVVLINFAGVFVVACLEVSAYRGFVDDGEHRHRSDVQDDVPQALQIGP